MTWTAADHARHASELLTEGWPVAAQAQAHALTAIALALTDRPGYAGHPRERGAKDDAMDRMSFAEWYRERYPRRVS